jgi:hypothetical protein
MTRFLCLLLALVLPGAAAAQERIATSRAPGVVLRGLDKLAGTTADIEILNGRAARFGTLDIALSECRYPAGNRAGDAYAGLQIVELGAAAPLFEGWMIASAPALSALDHPRYDIWVLRCITS